MVQRNSTSTDVMTLADKTAMQLRKDIQNGIYAVGHKLADEYTLAEQFSVSRGTIRQALEILEKERLISRLQGRGTFVAHPMRSPNKGTETLILGAMVYGAAMIPQNEYFFGTILQEAFSYSASRGYILATGSNQTAELESQNIETFIRNRVKGVIMAPMPVHSQVVYDRLIKADIPVVLLDSVLPGCNEDFVGIDNYFGMEMVTNHLLDLGHTSIGYVGYGFPSQIRSHNERLTGFLSACLQRGLKVPPEWQITKDIDKKDEDDSVVKGLVGMLSKANRPTAVVAFNDVFAIQVIQEARQLGLKIPDDLSVIGFDDSFFSRNYDITITTINPKPNELGRAIIDMLIGKIENPEAIQKHSILIAPELVIRESTDKVRRGV
jgi:GntR family transcriptional regulator, arabinose operon transcriptional repressor